MLHKRLMWVGCIGFALGLCMWPLGQFVLDVARARSLDPDTTAYWLRLMESSDHQDRQMAMHALAAKSHDDPDALRAMIDALRDEDPKVRRMAVVFLGINDYLTDYIEPALKDPDEEVRQVTASVIAQGR